MPKLKVSLSIGYENAKREEVIDMPEELWNSVETDEGKEMLINDYAREWVEKYIDIGAEIIE